MKKVFISYAREDIETARKLCDDLREAGADTWLDDDELIPGQDWKAEITKAIKKSGHFIALISTKSVEKRGFVQTELKKALEVLSNIPGKDIFIIPARIDDCGIPDELEHLHCADLFPDYERGFSKILRAIPGRKHAAPSEPQKPVTPAGVEEPVEEKTGQAETPVREKPEVKAEKPEVKPEAVSTPGEVYKLRSEPITLSDDDVKTMLKKHNFFDSDWNKSESFKNDLKDNGNGTITDSVTGLMWQKSGSDNYI
ncbi:MAG: TIR domain-containing protein [Desulfobacteraceae bacterium]|nr:TIR domain-containing protein [Desulfobacteraceae bacterium]